MLHDEAVIELHQFRYSHYNEKARWALAVKGAAHERVSYLPGPHSRLISKLSGQAQVPVLKVGTQVIAGSDKIIDFLEARYPLPRLWPEHEGARKRAADIVTFFDDEVGPCVRRAHFSTLVHEPAYLARMFAGNRSPASRFVYRWMLPLVRSKIERSMGLAAQSDIDRGFEVTQEAFDFVAREAGPTGYLVGGEFTVADLTAAALLAPAVDVQHKDMKRPRPMPASVKEWLDRWRDHAGAQWVLGIYEKHRPASKVLVERRG